MTDNEKTQVLFSRLERGLAELIESGDWRNYLFSQSKFHRYSFNNVLLILLQKPDASRIAGYQTWRELGRQVKRGERALQILAPLQRKRERENEKGESETFYAVAGFKTVSVFDISQTEGDDLPEIRSCLLGDDGGLSKHLLAFSNNNHVPVYFEPSLEGANGTCHFRQGKPVKITVDPLLPRLHQAKTLAHEIAHSLLHGADQYRGHSQKSLIELEAESVAFIVTQHFGLDSSSYSFPYIAGWQKDEPDALENLKTSGHRIQKAASQMIDSIESMVGAQFSFTNAA